MKKSKSTPTVRYLLTEQVNGVSEIREPVVNGRVEGGRMAFQNLCPKKPVEWDMVTNFIREFVPTDMLFYLDTNIFIGEEKPDSFWESLLERQVVITPGVEHELSQWLNNPARNRFVHEQLVQAKKGNNSHINFLNYHEWDSTSLFSMEYYVCLLLVRKQSAKWLVEDFFESEKRTPTKKELQFLVNKKAADHERRLINKGLADIEKPNFYTDEELVVAAAVDALVNERETTVISGDGDIQTQFVKLMQLLDRQYQGLRFAEIYTQGKSNWKRPKNC